MQFTRQPASRLTSSIAALLAAAVLTQFGVDTHNPNHGDREVRRVVECRDTGSNATLLSESKRDC